MKQKYMSVFEMHNTPWKKPIWKGLYCVVPIKCIPQKKNYKEL